jgi:hypothetical protein
MLRRAQDPREAIEAGEDNGWTLATVPGALSCVAGCQLRLKTEN